MKAKIDQLQLELAAIEPDRKAVVGASSRDTLLGIAILIVGVLSAWMMLSTASPAAGGGIITGFLGVAIGGFLLWRAHSRKSEFMQGFKLRVIPRILDTIQPGLDYSPGDGIPLSIFNASRLFSERADRYEVEDRITGRLEHTDFMLSEIHAQQRHTSTDGKGNTTTSYRTFFRGIFMQSDFHKHFRSTVRIMPNRTAFLGRFGRMLSGFRPFSHEKLLQFEDVDFEREFNVYGSDDLEARYILTPGLMRRIVEIQQRWNHEVRLSFFDSCVCIAIQHGRNLFEPDLNRTTDCRQQLESLTAEIRACLGIIDDLNLNTRIWTKT